MVPYTHSMRLSLVIAVLLALVVLPVSSAAAQATNAPPGLSGVDEYLETVPGAGGAQTPGGGKSGGGSLDDPDVAARADAVVGSSTVRKLAREGEDGKRAAALAATGAPEGASVKGAVASVPLSESGGDGAVGQIFSALTGGAGAGAILPVSLILFTAMLGAAALRRRSTVA